MLLGVALVKDNKGSRFGQRGKWRFNKVLKQALAHSSGSSEDVMPLQRLV